MFTTVDKALAGGVVAWGSQELATHFHVLIPTDVQTALVAVITALAVWLIPNKAVQS